MKKLLMKIPPVELALAVFVVSGVLIVAPGSAFLFMFGGANGSLHQQHLVAEYARLFVQVGSIVAPLAGAISVTLYFLFWPFTKKPALWRGFFTVFGIEVGCFIGSILVYWLMHEAATTEEALGMTSIVWTGYLALPWWIAGPPVVAALYAIRESMRQPAVPAGV
jgi:hypothetical protein